MSSEGHEDYSKKYSTHHFFPNIGILKYIIMSVDIYLLKCSLIGNVVSPEKVHPRLWVGSNRKFRAKPYGPTHTDKHNKVKWVIPEKIHTPP